jgi:hypothetical protein
LSEAVNAEIETVSELDVGGIVKAVTVGAVVSVEVGRVIVVDALLEFDTLPAASLANA